ncbi:MAG: M20/M25/M40 family metallo-hydrolase [Leptolyngbyaceae cyanobacterium MO_188.B28]|nr:M20/M25/M40 family metallo-hydrolase [Leptolyngbyaceae cyanobacterium MO_188.B28]
MKKEIIVTFLTLALFAFLGIYQLNPPATAPINAPPTEFSSGRAMKHLAVIAQKPHPIGSPENTAVRDYILRELEAQALSPSVQETTAVTRRWGNPSRAGLVQNIVARLPGTDNTQAVLLAAHYDSVPTGPGASDDGAAVAALLETIRALRSGTPLRNDVIFLFTDGEEVGLLGAKAFVDEHPWANDVGVALNFEARGNSGPSLMFETSNHNDWLIQQFAASVPHPAANSLMSSVYKTLPNNTDFTLFKEAGWSGFNFAYIHGLIRYHTVTDSVNNLDQGSLQHHGSYALALARQFGDLDLSNLDLGGASASDRVYFDFLGLFIHYPNGWVGPLTGLVMLLFIGVAILGLNRQQLTLSGVGIGFLAFTGSALGIAAIVALAWWSIVTLHGEYRWIRVVGDTYHSSLYMLSFTALTLALASGFYGWLHAKVNMPNLAIGAWIWQLILMGLTSVFLPGGSYLFTWPLLFSILGLGITFALRHQQARSSQSLFILTLFALPGITLLTPTLYLIYIALGLNLSGAIMLMIMLLLGLLIPHLCFMTTTNRWLPPTASLLLSLGLMAAGHLGTNIDANHPKPNSIFYGLNADTGRAIWASSDEMTDEWTAQFLSATPGKGALPDYLPMAAQTFLQSEAPAAALAAPSIEAIDDDVNNEVRTMRLRITVPRPTRLLRVYIDSAQEVLRAAVNGKFISNQKPQTQAQSGEKWGLHYFAPPPEGIELTLTVKSSQPLAIRTVSQSDGLPEISGGLVNLRPAYLMPDPKGIVRGDSTLVSTSRSLKHPVSTNK